ncbi:MAG: hypothetical protein C5B50_26085 [Verrucomicrobia bacterium]|nr:MAG: hypothetical protein C5B50_26085 [Verrucomicrobiota bacterium]
MKKFGPLLTAHCLVLGSLSANAQVTLNPLTSWGNNGWLAPGGADHYVTTGTTERGLAYGNGHVYLVSRANVGGNAINIRIMDPNTGADLGGLATSGISGGTFAVNAAGVGGDGTIYVCNVTSADSSANPFKVYSWATESATPTVAYSSGTLLSNGRIGDALAANGSGASTTLVVGISNANPSAPFKGYGIVNPPANTGTAVTVSAANTTDFRLSLSFTDSSHVIGTEMDSGTPYYRYTSFSGSSGTLIASPTIPDPGNKKADRLLSYTVIGGRAILAVANTVDSHVSIYDVTDPINPVWLASQTNTFGSLAVNMNWTGAVAWGPSHDNGDGTSLADLYTLSTSQGIQAFVVTVPEPGVLTISGLGIGLLGVCRGRRRMKLDGPCCTGRTDSAPQTQGAG